MSVATKRKLARKTIRVVDETLTEWQEAFGRGDCDPKDCAPIVDAVLDLRNAAKELVAPAQK